MRLGSGGAKKVAVVALLSLANNDANAAAIAAAGGLAPLEQLARDGDVGVGGARRDARSRGGAGGGEGVAQAGGRRQAGWSREAASRDSRF